jgi:hypothetical protein
VTARRPVGLACLVLFGFLVAVGATTAQDDPPATTTVTTTRTVVDATYRRRFVRMRRYARKAELAHARIRRVLLHDPTVAEALDLACATYGNCATLKRRARCESKLDPQATNKSSKAAGLLQFLWSTWSTTPYARFSPYSPYANALAAGWMIGPAGRGGEWDCR